MNLPRRSFSTVGGALLLVSAFIFGCGGYGGGNGGGGGGGSAPAVVTGLTATAGDKQVVLNWSASTGATGYYVKRSATSGSGYTQVAAQAGTTFTDTGLTDGTTYYYVVAAYNSYGTSANSAEVNATPTTPATVPSAPTGLTATAGNGSVNLTWNASSGATSYNVKRGTASGAETQLATATTSSYSDTTAANGTKYFYVVTAHNSAGDSGLSNEVSATPTAPSTAVNVSVNVLADRHPISPYIYGGAYPKDASTITDSGLPVVRWGGNATSTYNWKLFTYNADNDYYFEDFTSGALNNSADADSVQFVKDVKAANSLPLMTMVMLPWVAQAAENGSNGHWSFPDSSWPSQCKFDPYNSHAGNGQMPDCSTNITAKASDIANTYFPILDDTTQSCSTPPNCVYRKDWSTALSAAFGSAPHFYDMDNEIDIWGGTHRDIHPNPTTYDELANIYVTSATNLKGWDPQAIRFGPVSCCWYFYWRSATGSSDTSSHGGVDFLPWWINQVAWKDAVSGSRSLDVFDIHAYPDADTNGLSTTALKALAAKAYRDWWDPTFTSPATYIKNGGFSNEPLDSIPFRIPRMRAILNQTYPGTQFSITEWSAEFAGGSDFSSALGDADAYGVLGREHVYLSTRWVAPDPANPNYQTLKLYTNYDGSHHGFGTTSVSATNNGNPDLFSSYAALDSTGTKLTVMVVNKDPQNGAQVTFALNGFTATTFVSYTLASSSPTTISSSSSAAWSGTQTFAPYSATLLVITGSMPKAPLSDWDLNPDTIMVPASGTVTLQPKIIGSGAASVTLSSAVFDAFEGASACSGGSIILTAPTITPSTPGTITVTAPNTSGFCHFTVTGSDGTVTQTEGGWLVVGKPAAMLAKTIDPGSGTHGTSITLAVTLTPGSSGGTQTGAIVLFSTDAGSFAGASRVIATTDSSGVAKVTLTLPSTTGTVHVTAEGPYGLGHPMATFTETSN